MLVRALVASLAIVVSSPVFAAESAQLKIPDFGHLEAKAVESVDVTIGPFMLWLATKLSPEQTEDGVEAKKVLQGIKSVYIKAYKFETENAYSKADIDKVREQLQHERWKPLVEVRNKNAENVDIFVAIENDTPSGFAVIASEPKEFTIINIVGTIDPQHLGRIQGSLGLPSATTQTVSLHD